ncbi:MAG: rhodanese-like domain-containing protein [Gemmatales bacterium]
MFNASIRASESEDGFVNYILEGQPEPPLYFARMKRDNKMGPKVLSGVPKPRQMSVTELQAIDGHTCAVVDARPWNQFKAGHVPGALSLPLLVSFSTDAGSIIDEHESIYLIVDPLHLDEAVRGLIRVGLDNIQGWFPADELKHYGKKLTITAEVDVRGAQSMIEQSKLFILDSRRRAEFVEGHLGGAVNISHTRQLSRLAELPKDRHILVSCRTGTRSARVCSLLEKHGYEATNLAGGFVAWEQAKAPVER